MSRPLLITDCDEVLLHMVVPFAEWADETHAMLLDIDSDDFTYAMTHKACGTVVEKDRIWPLLQDFFRTEMHRQLPISGAIEAIKHLSDIADIVVLTNISEVEREGRREQLRAVGVDVPVFCNSGPKGEPLARIVAEYAPSVAVFVDDLGMHHDSVAEHAPDVWRLHLVGEPRLAGKIPTSKAAHARIDDWESARNWILARFEGESVEPA
jgi:hypothetical protein